MYERSYERSHRSLQKIVQLASAFESALDTKWAEKKFAHFVDAYNDKWAMSSSRKRSRERFLDPIIERALTER